MTSILKPSDDGAPCLVRPLNWATTAPGALPEAETLDPELVHLRAETERLEEELAALRAEVTAKQDAAREEGRRQAASDHVSRDETALSALHNGIEKAQQDLANTLSSLDRVAFGLAETALQAILDDPSQYRHVIGRIVTRQMTSLRQQTVLSVCVSAKDFPDAGALHAIRLAAGLDDLALTASPNLAAGACRMKLTIGEIDVDTPKYWHELRSLLRDLADGDHA